MPELFSTKDVHPRDRLAYWADFACASLVGADCTVRRDEPFPGELRVASAGELCVVQIAGNPVQSVTRSKQHVARDRADGFGLVIQHLSGNVLSRDRHEAVLRPGDLVLFDGTPPWPIGGAACWRGCCARAARRQAMTAAARERVADNILDPDRDGAPIAGGGRTAFARNDEVDGPCSPTARPTWPSLAPCSPPSSPLRAASGGGLAASLDRGCARRLPQSRSGRRNGAWSNRETALPRTTGKRYVTIANRNPTNRMRGRVYS
jgi:hypothetical protein